METREQRINSQIERSKKHYRKRKAEKLGKFSLFTGTTLGLSGIFANSITTKAVSSNAQTMQKSNNSNPVSNPAPSSSYNFSKGLSQVTYLTQSQYSFLNEIAPTAQKLASQNNLYASIMIAQAIIESAWGQSGLASAPNYNLFGVKGSYMGSSVSMPTFEQTPDGTSYSIVAAFAKYPGYEDSMKGYIRTMLNPLYVGAWRSTTNSYQEAAHYLTGRYATAINYGDTLISIIQRYNLNVFDSDDFSVDPALKGISVSSNKQTYKIQKGDSLWGISRKFGVSLDSLLQLNNFKLDSKIFPDQVITIKEVEQVNLPDVTIVDNASVNDLNKPSLPLPTETKVSSSATGTYTVKQGDSLYRIALKNGISLADLLKINGLTEKSVIVPGQKLKITGNVLVPNSNVQAPTVTGEEYTVQKGDSLYRIAIKAGINLNDLLKYNNLSENAVIVPGQKLIIRKNNNDTSAKQNEVMNSDAKIESSSYTVKQGDTLAKISQRSGVSVEELLSLNNLKIDSMLFAGQNLIIKAPVVQDNTYTVQQGDTLYGVAKKYNISLTELLNLNNLKIDTMLFAGQKLIVKQVSTPATVSENSDTDYLVQQGDTLYGIAKKFNISLTELLKLNNLTESSVISQGQKLTIKASQTPAKNKDVSENKETVYTVQQGDTLYGIAKKHNIGLIELLNLNNLKVDTMLFAGQKLIVKQASTPEKTDETPANKETTYIVQQGDTLYGIAKKANLSLAELLKLNNLTESSKISVGQKIITKVAAAPKESADQTQDVNASDEKEPNKVAPAEQKTYTVKQGDSLYKIATANHTTINNLEQLNNLPGDIIIPGQTIRIQ
ncbi:LysM peptidoglycan-binding domain-containing protein [Xylocopilactobacillus apicola]|uniref:Peptidoglycan hydrolase n=1 Tax=Xylocopilactobacillus apicola TaxID=2932184 RepID=A0AAU9D422_9LACO|nr:LysM peptidoglycan-binding domain-containing protein [Xylocopilactobacillus apicola]BDR58524.1 hypothetical protein XA3_09650 [Xylocopilactobacillus apicola]